MQLLSRYLVDNTTTLVADVAGFITEYRPVYNREIQVYKGIDNALLENPHLANGLNIHKRRIVHEAVKEALS